jgi:broad specificity phosphatase PhoE
MVRHGATEWNITKRAQGLADIELDASGMRQAEEAAARLSPVPLVAVYSSALKRSIATATAIARPHGLEVQEDAAFNEIDQGEWTGLSTSEIARRWPDLWGANRHHSPRPGGESPQDVRKRALAGLKRIVDAHPEGVVVLVSHGGTIRWLTAEALGYDDVQSMTIRGLGNGQAVSIDARLEDGRLVLSNVQRLDGSSVGLDDPND